MFRHIHLEKDPPPQLEPGELPSPEQMGRIARELLREMRGELGLSELAVFAASAVDAGSDDAAVAA